MSGTFFNCPVHAGRLLYEVGKGRWGEGHADSDPDSDRDTSVSATRAHVNVPCSPARCPARSLSPSTSALCSIDAMLAHFVLPASLALACQSLFAVQSRVTEGGKWKSWVGKSIT
jgi:hypothetical protein